MRTSFPALTSPHWTEYINTLQCMVQIHRPPLLLSFNQQLSKRVTNKAPGIDVIPSELYRSERRSRLNTLFDVLSLRAVWTERNIPQDFKDALVIPIYKRKGNKQQCGNYTEESRCLQLLGKFLGRFYSVASSPFWTLFFYSRGTLWFPQWIGTIDMIFTLRQLQEKAIEQNMPLFIVFILDFTRLFTL